MTTARRILIGLGVSALAGYLAQDGLDANNLGLNQVCKPEGLKPSPTPDFDAAVAIMASYHHCNTTTAVNERGSFPNVNCTDSDLPDVQSNPGLYQNQAYVDAHNQVMKGLESDVSSKRKALGYKGMAASVGAVLGALAMGIYEGVNRCLRKNKADDIDPSLREVLTHAHDQSAQNAAYAGAVAKQGVFSPNSPNKIAKAAALAEALDPKPVPRAQGLGLGGSQV